MKKVFVYIGSRNDNSILYTYLNRLIENISLQDESIKFTIYKAYETNIFHSTGCKSCFTKGKCPQDQLHNDRMEEIKRELLESDFVILASPVYSHNVSGDMKAFIDRLSYWGHLFRLAGKPGLVVASGGNGLNHVLDYLEKVSTYMGIITIGRVSAISGAEIKEEDIANNTHAILKHLKEEIVTESNDALEAAFLSFKWIYENYPEDHVEHIYWRENGFFECDSFQEVLDKKVKILK
ncbi:flavodoxin family protein [Pradoshia sp. D12]|uniref:flavodoxin family protein n=1 Tax=Bacillaceae TaxID=186817 RepID=UPI00112AB408|nr:MULTISPECIES: flavodoxin family protein [Bacillaceae]QFK72954.1 flavodoxin family protein [Pradoshia sp. D12]TPF71946.1 flavodoxin family protein [Bacillus sp. D12]